jgi:3-oxoacyl-[acyl-carrier protein] reductase
MFNVKGRVALVTGCGSAGGIGFAIARALIAEGARVAVTSTTARIHDRQVELGAGFAGVADLTDVAAVVGLFAEVNAALGPVEILVNNALNVTTAFHCIRTALPAMQAAGFGRIVNMASVTGPVVTIDGSGGYATGKAALTGLTRSVALEYARHGITCNAVLPGWIATESSSAREIRAGKASPAARPGTPDEVAACALFLCSDQAGYVNGAMLVVDGANTLMEMKA